jgi:sulfatase modifying factor 1
LCASDRNPQFGQLLPGRSDLTIVGKGSYSGSASPYGTFDQGGNVWEWNEAITSGGLGRAVRSGSFDENALGPAASTRSIGGANSGDDGLGFRVAMIPEPSTSLLVIAGLLGLGTWRRRRITEGFQTPPQRA